MALCKGWSTPVLRAGPRQRGEYGIHPSSRGLSLVKLFIPKHPRSGTGVRRANVEDEKSNHCNSAQRPQRAELLAQDLGGESPGQSPQRMLAEYNWQSGE